MAKAICLLNESAKKMETLDYLRGKITSILQFRAMLRHGSRVGWRIAPIYTNYLDECRKKFSRTLPEASEEILKAVECFKQDGITSFQTSDTKGLANSIYKKIIDREKSGEEIWGPIGGSANHNYCGSVYKDFPELEQLFKGVVGQFLYHHYGTHFKIFYASMYKSVNDGEASKGSQLWHSDSGPGTCVIVTYYLNDVLDEGAGVLHALPWRYSMEIFKKEYEAITFMARTAGFQLRRASGESRRGLIVKYYAEAIREKYGKFVVAPKGSAGLIVPFLNNIIHCGGSPDPERERVAVLFHCYPSDKPADFLRYAREGLSKTAPYPVNPAE
jgi:hypothetical protein